MQVKDYMCTQVTTVTPEALVSTAFQLMTLRGSRIRHLPVVTEQNVLVGILTDRDVRRVAASDAPSMAEHELMYVLEKLRVRDIMTRDVVSVRGTTPLKEAGQLLLQKKFGCLPVIRDDNRLEGILTVTDFLRAYVEQHDTGRAGACK
jgi:acetoin utilization protein AcuB